MHTFRNSVLLFTLYLTILFFLGAVAVPYARESLNPVLNYIVIVFILISIAAGLGMLMLCCTYVGTIYSRVGERPENTSDLMEISQEARTTA